MSGGQYKKVFGMPNKTNWVEIISEFIDDEYIGMATVIEILRMCALMEEYLPLIERYGLPNEDFEGFLHCIIQEINPELLAIPED